MKTHMKGYTKSIQTPYNGINIANSKTTMWWPLALGLC